MNAAVTDSEHEQGLFAEGAQAAAALDLDEDANTAAAKERPKRRDAMSESQEKRPVKETMRSEVSLRRGEPPRRDKNTN